eukprot:4460555-Pyramimonas_sp.AAC.1
MRKASGGAATADEDAGTRLLWLRRTAPILAWRAISCSMRACRAPRSCRGPSPGAARAPSEARPHTG